MSKIIRFILVSIGFIILTLIITNPSYTKFKEYSNEPKNPLKQIIYRRTKNYLIFSIYEKQINTASDKYYASKGIYRVATEKYLGIFMNFYPIR